MPLVTGNQGVDIPFTGNADKLVAESKRAVKEMDEIKEHARRMSEESVRHAKVMEAAAKKQKSAWTEFRSMYSTVLDVVRVGQEVWDEFGGKFVNNAIAAGDMARQLGTTTEEASRLKEVADDLGVDMKTLERSFKAAQKDGISPTLEGLAQLSGQYLKLAPGVERTQFLLDKFGKSGDEMAIVMEKGGDGIRAMSDAVADSLIVTQKAYEQARDFKLAQDQLNDAWDAFTYTVAPPLIDATTDVLDMTTAHTRALEIMEEQGLSTYHAVGSLGYVAAMDLARAELEAERATVLATDAAKDATGAFESEAEQAAALKEQARLAEQAIKDMTDANKGYLDQIEKVTGVNEDYISGVQDANKALADGKITIDEHKAKLDELAAKREETTHRMMLSMLEQQLAEGGLDKSETEFLLKQGTEWGIYSETAIADMAAAQREVDKMTAKYKTVPPVVETRFNTYHNTYYGGSSMPSPYSHAAGGSFMIPQSYGNEGFQMGARDTASGGERLTVTPEGKDIIDYDKMAKKIGRSVAQAMMQAGA